MNRPSIPPWALGALLALSVMAFLTFGSAVSAFVFPLRFDLELATGLIFMSGAGIAGAGRLRVVRERKLGTTLIIAGIIILLIALPTGFANLLLPEMWVAFTESLPKRPTAYVFGTIYLAAALSYALTAWVFWRAWRRPKGPLQLK